MYEIEKGRHYYYPLSTLKYSYNIPRSFEESYLKSFWIKYTVLTLCQILISCVMPMLHFTMSLIDNTGVNVAEDLSVCLGGFGCILTVILFTLYYKKWSEFLTKVTVIRKFQPSINVEKFVRNLNRFAIIYLCYIFSGITLYGIVSLSESSHCKQLNEENGLHESCYNIFSIWLPFDTNDIFSAITILTIQIVGVNQLLPSCGMVFFIVLESAEILILHINILKENFVSLFEETSKQEISAKLRFCINYHNHILQLGEQFNTLQKYTVGHVSFIAALIFGCILNQMQNTKPFGAAIFLVGCVTAVAMACHSGQRIIDQTSSIADAIYESNWIKADPQTMKDLSFIILRCQTPIYLNCIPLGIYNYALFITIMKTSYSYLTLVDGAT